MTIITIKDKYNDNKEWIIKKYKSSNYYMNQKISGKKHNSKFIRTTKKYLKEIINF